MQLRSIFSFVTVVKSELEIKLDKRSRLRIKFGQSEDRKEKENLEKQLEKIENEIADIVSAKNLNIIKEQIQGICNIDGAFCANNMWKIKKKLFPKNKDYIEAKKDEQGNIITDPKELLRLYEKTYKNRFGT